MNLINTYLTNNILFFILCILTSCSAQINKCEVQLQNELEKGLFTQNKLIVLEKETKGTKKWKFTDLEENSHVGNRFYYEIDIA